MLSDKSDSEPRWSFTMTLLQIVLLLVAVVLVMFIAYNLGYRSGAYNAYNLIMDNLTNYYANASQIVTGVWNANKSI